MIADEKLAMLRQHRGAALAWTGGICECGVQEVRGMYVFCFGGANGIF
jgi:hypothetical protein